MQRMKRFQKVWGIGFALSLTAVLLVAVWATMQSTPVQAAPEDVIINELDADQVGTDAGEFIELYDGGTGNTPLDGLSIVLFNGSNDASYAAFDLDTYSTDADGYFVLCGDAANVANCDLDVAPDTNLIQNGADAAALYMDDAANFPTDTPITTTNLLDAIVYDTDDGDDAGLLTLLNAGQPQVNERDGGDGSAHSNQRCANGSGGARNTDTYIQDIPTPGETNNCPVTTAVLAVDKTADPTMPFTGDLVTYTIVAANTGAISDTNVVLTDNLPADVAFASWVDQPAGAMESGGTISWSGMLSASQNLTFTFVVTNNAAGNSVVTNTVMVSGTSNMDTAEAVFTTAATTGDITFVYYDLEDVVQPGELIFLAGNFNGFDNTALSMTANADNSVFTATVPGLSGMLDYKYVVDNGNKEWDWLNTDNRTYDVTGNATIEEYRNITTGYANLNTSGEITVVMNTATSPIYGETFYNGVTNPAGSARGLVAEVGYGTDTDLSNWMWMPADFNQQNGNNDEYGDVLTPTLPGTYSYTVRFNGNSGAGNPNSEWVYADSTGVGPYPGGEFSLSDLGVLNVTFDAVPIATARAGALDEIFAVEGTVTYIPGTYAFAGWALQDASGGIAVFDGGWVPTVDYGDQVRLIGVRGQFSGETQFDDILYFENLGAGAEVTPVMTDTAVVATGSLDGIIVTVQGLTENLDNCNDNFFAINDGSGAINVFIDSDTNIDLCVEFIDGNGVEVNLTGFATNFNGTPQIKPRRPADVFGIFDQPFVFSTMPMDGDTNVTTTTNIDVTFSETVTTTGEWADVACTLSGNVDITAVAGTDITFTIDPTADFVNGDICNVTIYADGVTDADGNNMLADYNFSFTVGTPTFGACSDPATLISFVQGDGFTSPLVGTDVTVEAIISARYDSLNGFYLQEEAADDDGNMATSEGIFVYDPDNSITYTVGSVVRMAGTVSEFRGATQLGNDTEHLLCGTETLAPTIVTLPLAEADDWEQYEGMWISIEDELTVTDSFRLGRFGQVRLSINGRLPEPTNVVTPGMDANMLEDLNQRSFVTIDDALTFQNPDPVVYPEPMLSFTNTLRGGDTVPNGVEGIIDHYNTDSSDDYRLFPTETVNFTHTNTRPQDPPAVGGSLQVASFNVLNYFTTFGERGADNQEEFDRQRAKIINAIVEMDADIVGLMEIENHPTDEALQDLVDGLNTATITGTYAYIDTGVIGTDAIKVALIYQTAVVTPTGAYTILDSSVDPNFNDTRNRPVLIQTFTEQATGGMVTVAVNHLKSKGSSCDDIGDPDTGDGQGNCNLTRLSAAQALVDYLATDPTNSGSDNFLIIGDLNSYAMEDPIMAIQDAGYTNLIAQFEGESAYGYTFDGNWGYLDHALSSAALTPLVTGTASWHINADEPIVLDYNTNFKSAAQIAAYYSPQPYRSSDHDPVIVGLSFPVVPTVEIVAPMDGAVYTLTTGTTAVTIPVTISTTNFTIPEDGHWHISVNGAGATPVMTYTTMLMLAEGEHVITAELHTPTHTPLGISDSVTVTVVAETVEPQPPAPPVVTAPISGTEVFSQPTFIGTAEPGATIVINDGDGEPICETVADETGAWTCTPAEGLPLGMQTFSVVASNDAGESDPTLLTLTVVEETVPPVTYSSYLPIVTRP